LTMLCLSEDPTVLVHFTQLFKAAGERVLDAHTCGRAVFLAASEQIDVALLCNMSLQPECLRKLRYVLPDCYLLATVDMRNDLPDLPPEIDGVADANSWCVPGFLPQLLKLTTMSTSQRLRMHPASIPSEKIIYWRG
jgi:hypothetical protein